MEQQDLSKSQEIPLLTGSSPKPFFIKLLNSSAKTPQKAHFWDAGYDIFATEDKIINSKSHGIISTGIAFLEDSIPPGYYCRIAPRSGLACKNGIDVGAGVVDRGYTGEIKVCLFNHSASDFTVKVGDKIAQLIFTAVLTDLSFITTSDSEVEAVETVSEKKGLIRGNLEGKRCDFEARECIVEGKRGSSGFGSTDVKH